MSDLELVDIDGIRFRARMRSVPGVTFTETAQEDIETLCCFYDDFEDELEEANGRADDAIEAKNEFKEALDEVRAELVAAIAERDAALASVAALTDAVVPKKRPARTKKAAGS